MIIEIVKGLHILAVFAWMAGLLYLPRIFAYHTRAAVGTELDKTFKTMEEKLLHIIMTPAMIVVLLLGAILVWLEGVLIFRTLWIMVKLAGVAFLVGWHVFLARSRVALAEGLRLHSERFWRATNELPFVAAAVIVLSVTTKFGS